MHISNSKMYDLATIDGDGDGCSDSSNNNGDVDNPNVCEKLHELVLTSTQKSAFHAHQYT